MIEPIKLLPNEQYWPTTLGSLEGKIEMLIRKINEISEAVNALTRAHTPARVKGVDRQCEVCGRFLPCECREGGC